MNQQLVALIFLITAPLVWVGTYAGFTALVDMASTCEPDVVCDSPGLPFLGMIIATLLATLYCKYVYRWISNKYGIVRT